MEKKNIKKKKNTHSGIKTLKLKIQDGLLPSSKLQVLSWIRLKNLYAFYAETV